MTRWKKQSRFISSRVLSWQEVLLNRLFWKSVTEKGALHYRHEVEGVSHVNFQGKIVTGRRNRHSQVLREWDSEEANCYSGNINAEIIIGHDCSPLPTIIDLTILPDHEFLTNAVHTVRWISNHYIPFNR